MGSSESDNPNLSRTNTLNRNSLQIDVLTLPNYHQAAKMKRENNFTETLPNYYKLFNDTNRPNSSILNSANENTSNNITSIETNS